MAWTEIPRTLNMDADYRALRREVVMFSEIFQRFMEQRPVPAALQLDDTCLLPYVESLGSVRFCRERFKRRQKK